MRADFQRRLAQRSRQVVLRRRVGPGLAGQLLARLRVVGAGGALLELVPLGGPCLGLVGAPPGLLVLCWGLFWGCLRTASAAAVTRSGRCGGCPLLVLGLSGEFPWCVLVRGLVSALLGNTTSDLSRAGFFLMFRF